MTGSPSPLPSPPPSALSSASSADSLSSYKTCSDFEAGPPSDADATPWYLRPTPSPVFPTSPSFEWELSFYTAKGGNDSLFFDESSSTPLSDTEAATPRCADFNGVKTEPASPVLLWDDFNFNAMQRSSTDGSNTLVNSSRSPTGSREGSDSERAPGKSSSATPEPCGCQSSDEGYEADSESRLARASLGRRATSSRKRVNLKRKRGHYDNGPELGGAGGPRVFVPRGHSVSEEDDEEGPAHKKRKAGPHPQSPAARARRGGGWREKMRKMKADGTFGAVMPGGTFLKMVLQTLNVNRR